VAALTIVAQTRPFVIGVDCHARTHTYAIIDGQYQATGRLRAVPYHPGRDFPRTCVGRPTDRRRYGLSMGR
jgi:hypothetical protein